MSAMLESAAPALQAHCFLCGAECRLKLTMPVDAKTFRPTDHGRIYECAHCLLGFVHPRPTPAETARFYELDAYYTQGASHFVAVPPPGLLSRLRSHLAWRVDASEGLISVIQQELPAGSTVVDIGCGTGHLLKALSERGHHAIGIERDASSVSRRGQGITVLEGSAEALPAALPAGSCDGVVFSHVIEHLVDPAAALRSAASLLKPSGRLFCEVPNNAALIAQQSGLAWEHLDIPRHLNFFNERSLAALTESAGLKLRRTHFGGYCRYFADSYIATEQRIFDQLAALPGGAHDATRNSQGRAWKLLAKTAFAAPGRKYDSVGIVASLAGS